MPSCLMLNRYTPQGIANLKQSPGRIDALKQGSCEVPSRLF